eukprot:scaffold7120_cov49-Cyclotella_meneghiniana.AAC.5
MFEKRTTSLLPSKNDSPALKSKWNWPCIFDCEDAPQSPASRDGATNGQASGAASSSTTVPADQIPLVVWLTGGPGCSSSLALLTENGPCTVNEDGQTTALNPHSWTESAHVLWLDQPANVGYSYGQDNDTNEEMISEDAYYFLQAFFQSEDGQKYKNNPLFIVGESYGGHYAPAIAHRIWRGNNNVQEGLLTLNLAGLAIGNGLTNPEIQYQYYSEMGFNNSHNLQVIDENTYNGMKTAEPLCVKGIQECNNGDGMLNTFSCQAAFLGCNAALTTPFRLTGLNPYDITKECGDNPLCYDFSHIETFMNLPDTKQKLHVDTHNPSWQTCNMGVNMEFHTDWMKDFSGYVADLLNADIPALIYAGDVDFICNYLGNKAWVYDAGHMVPSDQPEHALTMITQFLNGEALEYSSRHGFRVEFADGLAVVTKLDEKHQRIGVIRSLKEYGIQLGVSRNRNSIRSLEKFHAPDQTNHLFESPEVNQLDIHFVLHEAGSFDNITRSSDELRIVIARCNDEITQSTLIYC